MMWTIIVLVLLLCGIGASQTRGPVASDPRPGLISEAHNQARAPAFDACFYALSTLGEYPQNPLNLQR